MDQLVKDVHEAYEAYDVDKIEQMWSYKMEIMRKIIEADGGNWYNKRRGKSARGVKRDRCE